MEFSLGFDFDNTYARDLDGFYVPWQGDTFADPQTVKLNSELAGQLGLNIEALSNPKAAAIFTGSVEPLGATPLAQAYAGHQFGGFSPQLGDGRALLLGEVIDQDGQRQDIQLKGSGRTPFSRGGDGKAVLGPVLREYLFGEAMHALGIPTTRALAAATTGEMVMREGAKPGAVLTRVASSHIRIGTFQFFAARKETDKLKQLADYTIARHYPELADTPDQYLGLFRRVRDVQMDLVSRWVGVGFIHGVMNTDNVTISGETIDYGPCAFMDEYDPATVFSSIDRDGRYAYGNQPNILQWNLARFAETLLALINPEDTDDAIRQATNELSSAPQIYADNFTRTMRSKLGLQSEDGGDLELFNELFDSMTGQSVDFTSFFRQLAKDELSGSIDAKTLFADSSKYLDWHAKWSSRTALEALNSADRAEAMNRVNPVYIPRNHLVDAALTAAEDHGDYGPFNELLDVLSKPFTSRAGLEAYEKPAPEGFGPFKTFCGT